MIGYCLYTTNKCKNRNTSLDESCLIDADRFDDLNRRVQTAQRAGGSIAVAKFQNFAFHNPNNEFWNPALPTEIHRADMQFKNIAYLRFFQLAYAFVFFVHARATN